ncbi:MAG TPA: zinc-dependent alcohol dehydrogenase family protein [Gemmataceae bacterium]|nr:zinc-dependent alcohol dehydrogenase family protein [Gemmataceae bacterium]
MHAMLLDSPHSPLRPADLPLPTPGPDLVLIRVRACGVCRTDLHVCDGELPDPKLPLVLGHEVVGTVAGKGERVERFAEGDRVGVPWLGWTCGECTYCRSGRENLCARARFTGYQIDGGYADYTVADQRYVFSLPAGYADAEAAPLLCAGLIGYRSLVMAGDAQRLGLYGFGAAAHIVAQVARHQGRRLFAFTRPGDADGQRFAREMGAEWAGGSDELPPEELDAALLFAPVGSLVPQALRALARGGTVVCGGIHMSDIPSFPYSLLWEERTLRSVANLTRRDGEEFLALAPRVPVRAEVETFPLADANEALTRLRSGRIRGAAVLLTGAAEN